VTTSDGSCDDDVDVIGMNDDLKPLLIPQVSRDKQDPGMI